MENNFVRDIIWSQFGASISMLENAIKACPVNLWENRQNKPEFWYLAYHTLFWLDFYLTHEPEKFKPVEPFTISELDPEGILPDRIYSRQELLKYLDQCRIKCKDTILNLTDVTANQNYMFGSVQMSFGELLIYNLRHVQHGVGQLNLILRQKKDDAPRWVKKVD